MIETIKKNRTRLITLAVLAFLFYTAIQGMAEPKDWAITVLRGLSVGAVTFLVAAGLSLILGLMDVLNLAHGEMFMIGAYVGWTVYVRPDTVVDVLPAFGLLAVGFLLMPAFRRLLSRFRLPVWLPWLILLGGLGSVWWGVNHYPINKWDPNVYAESPITYSLALSQGTLQAPQPTEGIGLPALLALLLGGGLLAMGVSGLELGKSGSKLVPQAAKSVWINAGILLLLSLLIYFVNDSLTNWLFNLSTSWRFLIAMFVATGAGALLGGLLEITLIRPLYDRPIYQIMVTLGVSFIGIEMVRNLWGRPEFTMPKPAFANGSGDLCPAGNLGEAFANQCSTMLLFGGRIRTYNEIFIILVGLIVLIGVWLLLQRTRLGMIIRAGVQDGEMVEALGINVRRVFTLVFALGVGLAALGGVLAAPSLGLSTDMGTRLLLLALIALAIGGLTSYPGAAAGAVLVGLMQQFIIKYGSIGINIPFLDEPFKPSPPLVPASTLLLMVIILLILPQGLFGRDEH